MTWLDTFRRLAKLNNWGKDLQLNALPLYMTGVAQAWVLSLSEEITSDLDKLFKAFQERFASGPQDWLLSQKLSARKQQKGESLDDYIADITRLSRRLKLSEKESMRVLIEGLLPDLQCHVSLGRPKTIQEAISLARIKDVVNQRQGVSDSQAILTQMQTMFKDLMTSNNAKVVAATATAPPPSLPDKRVDELSKQMTQLQKQLQQQSAASLAAYDQPPNPPRSFQSRNWQGQPNRQVEQLQRQVNRLEQELRRYQNPRQPDFRSYGRSFRSTQGDPICSNCQRVGHTWRSCFQRNRDPRLPNPAPQGPNRPGYSRPPGTRPHNQQLNG